MAGKFYSFLFLKRIVLYVIIQPFFVVVVLPLNKNFTLTLTYLERQPQITKFIPKKGN